ncbi:hypothetical protein FDP25_09900 [Roseovarius sp. A21]|uniref:CR-type domain-containing protein n=1 Tax=Roseovarius bejariae TaxID=2576383 RepID=A0A844CUM6_9RHOB|nr:hypothetical protein [Roseovarius bejariae]MRU15739.1 hypothetical protein [Roseovarius bejariae]
MSRARPDPKADMPNLNQPDVVGVLHRMAKSFEDCTLDAPRPYDQDVRISGTITLDADLKIDRLEAQPATGERFSLFKPKALKSALKAARSRVQSQPKQVVEDMAPEWLDHPVLSAKASQASPVLAYKKKIEKVVDRVETSTCGSCKGKGSRVVTRNEPTSTPCHACGGSGGRMVTTYVNSPGTTAHGTPTSEYRMCGHCGGSGKWSGPSRTVTETVTCNTCSGKGEISKTYYKKQTVFLAYQVETKAKLVCTPRMSRQLSALAKRTGQDLPFDVMLKASPDAKLDLRTGNRKLSLKWTATVPFCTHSVAYRGKEAGKIVTLPENGQQIAIADDYVFDRGLKSLMPTIKSLNRETIVAARQENFLLDKLADFGGQGHKALDWSSLAWSVSPKVTAKALKAAGRATKRGTGLLGRLGLG